jgi:Tfp pilus assembly protein PilF
LGGVYEKSIIFVASLFAFVLCIVCPAEARRRTSDAYSCLGEAYMVDGDKESAIASYKMSVELDPQNTDAAEMLKKLRI